MKKTTNNDIMWDVVKSAIVCVVATILFIVFYRLIRSTSLLLIFMLDVLLCAAIIGVVPFLKLSSSMYWILALVFQPMLCFGVLYIADIYSDEATFLMVVAEWIAFATSLVVHCVYKRQNNIEKKRRLLLDIAKSAALSIVSIILFYVLHILQGKLSSFLHPTLNVLLCAAIICVTPLLKPSSSMYWISTLVFQLMLWYGVLSIIEEAYLSYMIVLMPFPACGAVVVSWIVHYVYKAHKRMMEMELSRLKVLL